MTKAACAIVRVAWMSAIALATTTIFWRHIASAEERYSQQTDPSSTSSPPASMQELQIRSHGARINGLMYLPAGPGPHPVVIFLHGFPGNERNLDIAQAVRRAGYAAIYFDYRGNFGSGGTFSFAHSLEDTAAVLAWVRGPENAERYHIDPTRIALLGHSFGGWLALLGVERELPGVCVAVLAAWNVGWLGQRAAGNLKERTETLNYLRTEADSNSSPIRANADALLHEIMMRAGAWDYLLRADALKSRPLLLVAAARDTADEGIEMHMELAKAIGKGGGTRVRVETFEDDHAFSSHRIELADMLVRWLGNDCAKEQSSAGNVKGIGE